MNDCSILLAEAAVGTGKTLAYLLPAVLARRGRLNRDKLCGTLRDGHAISDKMVTIIYEGKNLQHIVRNDCGEPRCVCIHLNDLLFRNNHFSSDTNIIRLERIYYNVHKLERLTESR